MSRSRQFATKGLMIMAWQWKDLDAPDGQALTTTPITPACYQGRPYVFVWGDNGHLWANKWDGTTGHWEDRGAAPDGQTLDWSPTATASYKSNHPMAFRFGRNGHLWVNFWDSQTGAWKWQDQRAPHGQALYPSAVATASYEGNPMAFAWDSTGHLWVNWWTGNAWEWQPQGAPSGHTFNPEVTIATASYKGSPRAFVFDSTGHLWVNWWTGGGWEWQPQGAPPATTALPGLDDPPAAIATASHQGNPYVFCFGRDGHLWANWWTGSVWKWNDLGIPPGPDFLDLSAITAASSPDGPLVFTRTENRQTIDGHLWANRWDGNAGHWSEQASPPGTEFPMFNIAAISCQGTPYVYVWDDDSGSDSKPHLWVNWRSQ